MSLAEGWKLGPYEIISPLGAGGMGEVWRARDTKLDRDVAIKVLPDSMARDKERVRRFEREAKLLASLNHSSIAQIYGFEESEAQNLLVLEYVDGETLADRLRRGPLPIGRALEVAGKITEAVEAAHERGVIHRDLKPGNVMIKPDGQVKVLDFGLARAIREEPSGESACADVPTVTAHHTRPGAVLGTRAYMSPEQAQGQVLDKRTDVWSFGVVLYECLTGKIPFGGQTDAELVGAIIHREPDWSRLPTGTPPSVRRLLRRCLAKDVRRRLHHIADARLELEEPELQAEESVAPRPRAVPGVLAATLVMVLTLAAWSLLWGAPVPPTRAEDNPLAGARFSRITEFEGSEFHPAISPDGRFVAFVSDRDGPFEIFVSQIDTGAVRKLTWDPSAYRLVDDAGAPIRALGFTGDGSEIWFRGMPAPWRLRAAPLLGGAVRNLFGAEVVNVAWSPDRRRITYHTGKAEPGDPLHVADADGANSRLILVGTEGVHQHFPTWSVDGEWIFLVRGRPPLEMDLWRVRPNGNDAEQLTWGKLDVRYPTPIDERTVLYSALDADGAGPWLWALDVETKSSKRASVGMEQYRSVSASADGRRLVATLQTTRAALWIVPILDRIATEEDAERMPGLSTGGAFAPRLHGSWVYYLSSRGSGDGLWRYRNGTSTEIWRGSVTPLLEPVAISADGASIALVLRRNGYRRLHVLSADGAQRRALTNDVDARGAPAWSPDGRWIVVGGTRGGVSGLFKVPADGGTAERITTGVALNPVWSPDGALIVYAGAELGPAAPLRAVRTDGTEVELPDISIRTGGERMRFLPDGSGLVYMAGTHPSQDFRLLDLDTMDDRPLTQLDEGPTMRTFDVTPDGSRIVFDRLSEDSDIVLIERETAESPELRSHQ